MKKFLVLYLSSVSAREQMAKSAPAGMDAWMTWAKKASGALVDMGAPLGDGRKVTTGASSSSDSQVAGFSILQAESAKAVEEILKGHPHFHAPGSAIEVHEFLPIPGM
jgi:hypothetical protein